MTPAEIEQMDRSELDRQVAIRVMGLPAIALKDAKCPECGGEMRYCGTRSWCFNCNEWRYSPYREYSADHAADYEVLRVVREKWTDERSTAFVRACYQLWSDHRGTTGEAAWVDYEPGDYSKAALAVVAADAGAATAGA